MKAMRTLGFCTLLVLLLTTTSAYAQTFTVLYNFGTNPNDPVGPEVAGIIAQGTDGNLYSTAYFGGANNLGAAYSITPAGLLTVLHSFNGGDGKYPTGGLTLGTDGYFYGTTLAEGGGFGTIFKMTPGGSVTTLHIFAGGSDEGYPFAPPIQASDANFYGTTCAGCIAGGLGTIYKITPRAYTVLHQFDGMDGAEPQDPLVQGTDGNLYGVTTYGGTNPKCSGGCGTVFKITPAGKLTVLYNFDITHGQNPQARLVQGTDGNFYGTAEAGGTSGNGVVFVMTPTGNLTVVHNMNGTTDGGLPEGGLVQATDGNFYGMNRLGGSGCGNCGTIFKLTTMPAGAFSVVYNFDGTTGAQPLGTLVQNTNGILYGTTYTGGGTNGGVFFSLNVEAHPFVSLTPTSGKVGAKVGIMGQGFSSSSVVTFGTVAATTVTLTGTTSLTATVPAGATTGPVTVTTTTGTLTSNQNFKVTPKITGFSPPSGPVLTAVTITGLSLTQTTKVTFGGKAATSFTVNSDTEVTATVPSGATTGKIIITTPGGTASSATSFTVT